jgi:hypothetical protein
MNIRILCNFDMGSSSDLSLKKTYPKHLGFGPCVLL